MTHMWTNQNGPRGKRRLVPTDRLTPDWYRLTPTLTRYYRSVDPPVSYSNRSSLGPDQSVPISLHVI
jgi:hypothetical protein